MFFKFFYFWVDADADSRIDEDEWEEQISVYYSPFKVTENTFTIYGLVNTKDEFSKQ